MDTDLLLILGLCLSALAIPAVLSAISDSHPPRAAAIAFLLGGGMVVYALMQNPGGYTIAEIPNVFFTVIGRYIN
jgi:hypothetical protein